MTQLLTKRRVLSLIVVMAIIFSCVPISAAENDVLTHDDETITLQNEGEVATGGVTLSEEETGADDDIPSESPLIYSIVGFAELADEVKSQSVAVDTALEALILPDTLTATILEDEVKTEVAIAVTWQSDPEYTAITVGALEIVPAGTYVFTPELPEGYALADGVSLPVITVEVEPMGIVAAADDTWDGGTKGAQTISGGTITVNGTVAVTGTLTITGNVTFTGSGTLLRSTSNYDDLVSVQDGAKLTLDGVNIDGNTINNNNGSLVKIESGGEFEMTGGTISHNRVSGKGGGGKGGVYNSGSFIMSGGTISDNVNIDDILGSSGDGLGGGVYSSGTFTMTGGIISGNRATIGGGVYSTGTLTMMNGSKISGCNADISGGGVYSSGTLTMSDSEISGNRANGDSNGNGGGVHSTGTLTMMNGSEISDNFADENGGGVYNTGTFDMTGGTISGNSARLGGGVYNISTLEINGGTISDNTTVRNGGGVYNNGTFTLNLGTISGNTANGIGTDFGGGGVFNNGTFEMNNGAISGNYAPLGGISDNLGGGGGVHNASNCTFTMRGGEISDNTAFDNGGGVFNRGTFDMADSEISDNHANGGGGVYNIGTFDMADSEISSNHADANGGGVLNEHIFTINGGEISGNTADYGGGVYNDGFLGTVFTMNSGEISGNTAEYGGGVMNRNNFTMNGGGISGNTAATFGGGVYYNGSTFNISGSPQIENNIIAAGDPDTGGVYLASGRFITKTNTLTSAHIGVESIIPPDTGTVVVSNAVLDDVQYFYISNSTGSIGTNNSFMLSGTNIVLGTPAPAAIVTAAAATLSPEAGADNEITLTVKDSGGVTDADFSGSKAVTLTGVEAALIGTDHGTLGGTAITDSNIASVTENVTFTSGV